MVQTESLFHLTSNFFQRSSKNPFSENLQNATLRDGQLQFFSKYHAVFCSPLMQISAQIILQVVNFIILILKIPLKKTIFSPFWKTSSKFAKKIEFPKIDEICQKMCEICLLKYVCGIDLFFNHLYHFECNRF